MKPQLAGLLAMLSFYSCASFNNRLDNLNYENFRQPYLIENVGSVEGLTNEENERILLMLHGWADSAKKFEEEGLNNTQLKIADEIFDGRVLAGQYPSNDSLEEIVNSLSEKLDNFIEDYRAVNGKDPRFAIVGHSTGGVIATSLAEEYPQYVEKVATISAPMQGFDCILKGFFRGEYANFLDKKFNIDGPNGERYKSLRDLLGDTEFLKKILTPKNLTTVYSIFAVDGDTPLIPGRDDGVVSLKSALAENFGGNVAERVVFSGEGLNHDTILYNTDALRRIFGDLKEENYGVDRQEDSPTL